MVDIDNYRFLLINYAWDIILLHVTYKYYTVGEYLIFFQNNTRSKFTIAQN